jgi:PD-(D/E)XK nuclease superfamily
VADPEPKLVGHLPGDVRSVLTSPEQFRHRYILGEKRRPGQQLVMGGAFHSVAEANFSQKIESHEDLALDTLTQMLTDDLWAKQIEEQQEYNGEIEWDDSKDACLRNTVAMVGIYHGQVMPRVQPLAVEEKLDIDVGLPISLIGYTDVRTTNVILDMKTTKTARQSVKPDWQLQARIYGMAKSLPVDFHIVSPKKVITPLEFPALSVIPTAQQQMSTLAMVQELGLRANRYMLEYGPFEHWPMLGAIQEQYNKVVCAYCGWANVCPAAGGGAVVNETDLVEQLKATLEAKEVPDGEAA